MAAETAGWAWPSARHRDPVGEVEIGLARGIEQAMADAVAPGTLEVAPEDGRQVPVGERGEIEGRILGDVHPGEYREPWRPPTGWHHSGARSAAAPAHEVSVAIDFRLTDENRLVQQTVRDFAENEILPHIREWDEKGEVHREIFVRMAELGLLGAPIWEAVGRRRAWTTSASR